MNRIRARKSVDPLLRYGHLTDTGQTKKIKKNDKDQGDIKKVIWIQQLDSTLTVSRCDDGQYYLLGFLLFSITVNVVLYSFVHL